MDTPMILAAVGIGVAILLLAFLSIYQQARAKKLKAEKVEALRSAAALDEAKQAPAGKTPFFVACYRGNNARFFRVYRTPAELLFLHAGPYFVMIDAESARGSNTRHWLLRSLRMFAATVASGLAAGLLALATVLLAISRNPFENPTGAATIVLGILWVIGFGAVMLAIVIPSSLWWMTRRGEQLDALSLSGLVEQAATDEKSFRASPANVAEAKVASIDAAQVWSRPNEVCLTISFKHAPTGRWKIETLTTQDSRDAVHAFLAIWGRERIEIDETLVRRLETFEEWNARRTEPAVVFAGHAYVSSSSADSAPEPPQVYEPRRDGDLPPRPQARPETIRGGTSSVNGCGTMVCEARGLVEWDSNLEDSDAILAFCLLGVPIVPYAAVHTSFWEYDDRPGRGMTYRSHPIRWSLSLVGSAFVRRLWPWAIFFGAAGVVVAFIAGTPAPGSSLGWIDGAYARWLVGGGGLAVATIAFVVRYFVRRADSRHQQIRLLMGRHPLGSSDPAFWTAKLLKLLRPSRESFGTSTFAGSVTSLIQAGDFQRAMFAARLATALEDSAAGERLTDSVLAEPAAQDLIQRNRRKLGCEAPEPMREDWNAGELFA